MRVQVVSLASLCAILFLVSSFSTFEGTSPTVNCLPASSSSDVVIATAAAAADEPNQKPTTSGGAGVSTSAFVTNSDRVGAEGDSARSSSKTDDDDLGARRGARRQQAGKILDYRANESREPHHHHHHHHSLIPSRLNSTVLMRLVVAPFQNESSRLRSRTKSITGNERDNEQQQQHAKPNNSRDAPSKREGKCVVQGRSKHLGSVFRGARDLLTSGIYSIEQRAGNLFYLGSNLLATLIPLVSLLGFGSNLRPPDTSATAATANGTSGGASGGVASLLAPPQKLVQYAASSGGIQSRVEYVMDLLERSVEHLPSFPRLHPQECMKRSICEAHYEPTKYGAIGLTLRLLFPATNFSSPTNGEQQQDNMEFKVINKYRHAAGYGVLRRLDSANNNNGSLASSNSWSNSGACKEKYEDCLVSLLDVAQKLVDLFVT